MDETNGIPATMLVGPTGYGMNGGNGFGFGGDWAWILLLLVLCGGWGNGFGGGFGGGGDLYPWMNNSQNINDGFRDAQLHDSVTSVRDGISGISTQLCNGFAGVNASIANGFAQAEIANNSRQIADLQQMFGIQSAIHDCCCTQSANTADLKYTIATEACATRSANTQNTQAILDKLCQLELDGYKRENDSLRTQLNMANLAASQTAQTAELRTSQATIANQLVSELRSCPIPAQPVYGNTPIFQCNGNNSGCGCGF